MEFLRCNKIVSIVNCAGEQLDNIFLNKGINYYTLHWKEFKV